ncbi:cystic fibrosis transmembrane conductance regulator [Plakobranchus ocellatus]|uniref:Cystic fibrosis transmembrane conductance regulator n=1 Tax=Plakobranchus ocellatus TaxID=259542 RepID=A0AAV3YI55_9GAST|nr:cystic fibrosis transmembrane conductance regulator [Plakobranchus ocellatus]
MDETMRHHNPNPTLTANILAKAFYMWLNPLFKKGSKGWLQETDMYNACPPDKSKTLGDELELMWEKEMQGKDRGRSPSLLRALLHMFGLQYFLLGLLALFEKTNEAPTMEAAAHVSKNTRTCFGASAHQVGYLLKTAILFVLQPVMAAALVDKGDLRLSGHRAGDGFLNTKSSQRFDNFTLSL